MAEQQRCQWLDCTEDFADPEALYEHITSTHIGRKSAGTLTLACHWAACMSTATKRDHLTSHARVHINLKPHSCKICPKAFKRPQDLKKHEKIHTEEHQANHKNSKAVVAAPGTSPDSPVAVTLAPPAQPSAPMFAPFPFYPFPYGQHPGAAFGQHPSLHPQMDVNQFLEAQRQMNAQAIANPNFNLNPYGLPYGPPAGYPNMGVPMFAPPGMQSYPYGFYHPALHQSLPPPTTTAPATSPSNPPSLYPSLPPVGSLYPSLPVQNAVPNHPQQLSRRPSSASPVSQNAPSLSPESNDHSPSPPNYHSPSPEYESDIALRRMFSGNAVAGHKRAFEDAAGEFLIGLKSKRFQEEDLTQQVDQLDHLALLLTPGDFEPTHAPARSHERSSGPPAVPEYHPVDVENINDLLAHLAQSIDEVDVVRKVEPSQPAQPGLSQDHAFSPSYPASPSYATYSQPAEYNPMYPCFNSFDRPVNAALRAPMPYHQQQQQQPSQSHQQVQQPQYGMYPNPTIHMSKTPAAPMLSSDPSGFVTYRPMEHLSRSEASYRGVIYSEPMEIEDDEEEEMNSRKGYSSSIRSTSMDTTTSASTAASSVESKSPTIGSVTSQSPHSPRESGSDDGIRLASMVTTLSGGAGPRLPPLKLQSGSSSSTCTLPPLRDVIQRSRLSSSHFLPPSSSSAPESSFSRPPVVRSSTDGSLDRLLPGFTLLRVNRTDSDHATIDEDDSDAEVNHRSKKTRVDSPEPMDETPAPGTSLAAAEKAQARQLVIKLLLVLNNQGFRDQVVMSRQGESSAPVAARAVV